MPKWNSIKTCQCISFLYNCLRFTVEFRYCIHFSVCGVVFRNLSPETCFLRDLMRGLIWHFNQSYIALQFISVRLWSHARIRCWNPQQISNKGKVSCSRKQRGPLMGLEHTTSTLRARRATHCATPPYVYICGKTVDIPYCNLI